MGQAEVVPSEDEADWGHVGVDDCVDVDVAPGCNTAEIRTPVVGGAESMQARSPASLGNAELSLACA